MYLHELAADENGRSFAAVVNRKLGLGVRLDFDVSLFPYFMEWKSMGAGDYVVFRQVGVSCLVMYFFRV